MATNKELEIKVNALESNIETGFAELAKAIAGINTVTKRKAGETVDSQYDNPIANVKVTMTDTEVIVRIPKSPDNKDNLPFTYDKKGRVMATVNSGASRKTGKVAYNRSIMFDKEWNATTDYKQAVHKLFARLESNIDPMTNEVYK